VDAALKVYRETNDPVLQQELKAYLLTQRERAQKSLGKSEDNLEKARARQKTLEFVEDRQNR